MTWLIQTELTAAGQANGRRDAPRLSFDRPRELDASRRQFGDSRVEVIAHQKQLLAYAAAVVARRVNGNLGRWHREDRPAAASVHRWPAQHVAQERADLFR